MKPLINPSDLKRSFTRATKLMQRGLSEERAWKSAQNGRGPWWNSGASHMNEAFDKSFRSEAFLHESHKTDATRVIRRKGVEERPKWTRPLVELRSLAHE